MNRVQHLHTILGAIFRDFLRWGTLESRSSHWTKFGLGIDSKIQPDQIRLAQSGLLSTYSPL